MNPMVENPVVKEITAAFRAGDTTTVRELLNRHPALKAHINEPVGPFESPAILCATSREMLDVLLEAGADINVKSRWWAGGFGLLHSAPPELALYAIERGAIADVHAAARLGFVDKLRELIAKDPQSVHARGGDGQTPLHFAGTVEIAQILLDHGADIDALDVDHESTPAQHMIKDRQDVARFLVGRGCKTDLLMAAALGDRNLVQHHLDRDPDCIRMRVSDEFFPMVGSKCGGTIYQWTLGWYVSAHQVARQFGHQDVFQLLMQRSPEGIKLVAACWLGDGDMVDSLLAANPRITETLPQSEQCHLAHAARNNDLPAVRLLLKIGLPINEVGQHGATALHWAAFHGNAEMVEFLLKAHPSLESRDRDFQGTPMGWAMHGSEHGWAKDQGEYGSTVRALLRAGAIRPGELQGTEEVRRALDPNA